VTTRRCRAPSAWAALFLLAVRVETPFGLIRVDFGYQLNRIKGLRIGGEPEHRQWRINIGVGEAF
jgi:hypothetical protein